ncbi:pyridoxal phosphate-dependent aminotransferase [Actinomyces sp. zg-332]|uniref:pyridoxal phosphate-dependent aminotransferase n=1 Tax=Actinomyces sp. zg-332 TaxID=2708340 RepID=UPI001421484D|nr:pyridoxal phosphate-dependent aminotransferase [Actinomyces sp. zg-332]QPK94000.1 pyridoxal phosphate-dependent aminotransferase [Actinomyces sp. zg-332]
MTKTRISKRLGSITPSATLAVDAKAKELKAAGKPVIGFGAGEPDFQTPDYIVESAIEAAKNPANHRYSPTSGLVPLRKAIAQKTKRDSKYEVDPNNILVTNGGKQAVFQAFASILNEGDEAILPAPYWTTYPEVIALCGAKTVTIDTTFDTDFKITVDDLDKALTEKTKVLLLCSPSNPTGSVYTKDELEAIGKWCLEHGVWVITDEIYEHLIYDDAESLHIVEIVPELADQTIVVNGVAKTYAMTGWRIGWMIGPTDAIKAATNFQSHLTSNVCNIAQQAALTAVAGDLAAVYEMRESFDRRRKTMIKMLNEIEGIKLSTPKGAFYCYPNVEYFIGKTLRGEVIESSNHLAALVLEHAMVALVPGEAFGSTGYLRLSYALSDEDLVEGLTRVQKLLSEVH